MQTTFKGRITNLERRNNTPSGNPQYHVTLDSGQVFRTDPDAAYVQTIDNSQYVGADAGTPPLLTFTAEWAGQYPTLVSLKSAAMWV